MALGSEVILNAGARDGGAVARFRTLAFLGVLLALLALGRDRMMRDPGTLWHCVVGQQILVTGQITTTDAFSFTQQGQAWPAQQWLAECAMALIRRAAALDGLLLAACVILAAVYSGIAARARRAGVPGPIAVFVMLLAIAASSYHFMPRPHLATIALTAWSFGLMLDVESGRRSPRALLWLPPAMVLWTNLHGGALAGVASVALVLGGWLVRAAAGGRRVASPVLLGSVICGCVSAVLCNPYGAKLPALWIGLMDMPSLPKLIVEHAPLRLFSGEAAMILLLASAFGAALYKTGRAELRWTSVLPVVWLVMTMSRVRHGPLFAVTAATALVGLLPAMGLRLGFGAAQTESRWRKQSSTPNSPDHSIVEFAPAMTDANRLLAPSALCNLRRPTDLAQRKDLAARRLGWRFAPAVFVAGCFMFQCVRLPVPVIGSGWARLSAANWPVEAAEVLRDELRRPWANGRVFNDLGFGGYLIDRVPEAKVYIDDRCEFYGESGLRRYVELLGDAAKFDAAARYDDFRVTLLRAGTRLDKALSANDQWALLHRDATAVVYARKRDL